jgi:capsular exopolysaccharide synthesis family protein
MVAPKPTRPTTATTAKTAMREIALNQIYEVARRRWKTLVAFQIGFIMLAILFCFVGKQKYESTAQILVMRKDPALATKARTENEPKIDDSTLATQLQLLHSEKIIEHAMNKMVSRKELELNKTQQKALEQQTSTNLYYLTARLVGGVPELPQDLPKELDINKFVPRDVEDILKEMAESEKAAKEAAEAEAADAQTPAGATTATADASAKAEPMPAAAAPSGSTPTADAASATELVKTDASTEAAADTALAGDAVPLDPIAQLNNEDWVMLRDLPVLKDELDVNEKPGDYVKDHLTITRGGSGQERESHVLSVTFRHPDLVESKLVLDAILASYQKFLDEKFADVNKEAARLIEKASKELEQNLLEAQTKYQKFREQSPVIFNGTENTNIPRTRLEQTQRELLTVQLLLTEARSRASVVEPQLERLKNTGQLTHSRLLALVDEKNAARLGVLVQVGSAATASTEFQSNQPIRLALAQAESDRLLKFRAQLKSMELEYGQNHPEVQKLREEVAVIENYIKEKGEKAATGGFDPVLRPEDLCNAYVDLLRNDVASLEQREQDLLESASRDEEESKALIGFELEGESLREAAGRAERLYNEVLERLGEIDLAKDYSGFINEIIESPEVGTEVWPNKPLILALAVAMALMLGAGTAGAQEYFDRSFRDPDEVRRDLDVPLLTHVPDLHQKGRSLNTGASRVHYSIWSFHQPKSREAEVFRGLRTSLFFSSEGQQCSVIMATSPNKGDGKSTVVTNLAISIAQAGYKVLLIDCDMRRPSSHKLLGLSNAVGLSNLLSGEKRPGDVIQATESENLSVITSGPCPSNPAELLTSPAFESFLKSAREKYRFVLLDCPPVLAVADPCIIAPRADGIVLVLRVAQDSRPQALRAKEMLQRVNGKVLGVVVNASEEAAKSGYGRYGDSNYGYGYDYGYGHYSRNQGYYEEKSSSRSARDGNGNGE